MISRFPSRRPPSPEKGILKAEFLHTMIDHTLQKLNSLGLSLPAVPAPVAAYVNCVRSGNLLFLSGGLPIDDERKIIGKVPSQISIDEAKEGARMIVLNRLAVIREELGSLDKVKQIVALNGFVNSEPDFYGHPQVINGASELLVEIFGDKGKHSRTALGAAALPLNVAVEINLIVEIGD
jgi:enamine deaminase RidA (YjgF/YER057c/UK114 family)